MVVYQYNHFSEWRLLSEWVWCNFSRPRYKPGIFWIAWYTKISMGELPNTCDPHYHLLLTKWGLWNISCMYHLNVKDKKWTRLHFLILFFPSGWEWTHTNASVLCRTDFWVWPTSRESTLHVWAQKGHGSDGKPFRGSSKVMF